MTKMLALQAINCALRRITAQIISAACTAKRKIIFSVPYKPKEEDNDPFGNDYTGNLETGTPCSSGSAEIRFGQRRYPCKGVCLSGKQELGVCYL